MSIDGSNQPAEYSCLMTLLHATNHNQFPCSNLGNWPLQFIATTTAFQILEISMPVEA